jgi:hypothetical protein
VEPRYTEAGTILPQINWAKVPVIKAVGWIENVPRPVWVTVMVEVTTIWDCVWV